MPKRSPLWQNNSQRRHLMPDLLILSGKNLVDSLYLSQKLRFRISHLLLERVTNETWSEPKSTHISKNYESNVISDKTTGNISGKTDQTKHS